MNLHNINPKRQAMPSSGEVNWAQLAQHWIQTHGGGMPPMPGTSNTGSNIPLPPYEPGESNVYPPMPQSISPLPTSRLPMSSPHGCSPLLLPQFFTGPSPGTSLRPPYVGPPPNSWGPHPHSHPHPLPMMSPFHSPMRMRLPPRHIMPPFPTGVPPRKSFDGEDEQYSAHYDPSLDEQDYEASGGESVGPMPGVPPGAMAHWMADHSWAASAYPSNYVIDSQMRKRLPAWILEGLEKAEKEKMKKQEKEEELRKREEYEKQRRKDREARGLGKFDSSDESDGEEKEFLIEDDKKSAKKKKGILDDDDHDGAHKSSAKKLASRQFKEYTSVRDDDRTDEERLDEALAVVRRLMTTILMESTDMVLTSVATDATQKIKKKGTKDVGGDISDGGRSAIRIRLANTAQPKILQQSSALAALSALGDYDEDEDSSEHSDGGGESPRISRAGSQSPRRKTANTAKQSLATENENRFKVPLLPARPSRFSSSSMTAIETENEKTELATTIVGDEGRSNNSRHNSLQFKDELTDDDQNNVKTEQDKSQGDEIIVKQENGLANGSLKSDKPNEMEKEDDRNSSSSRRSLRSSNDRDDDRKRDRRLNRSRSRSRSPRRTRRSRSRSRERRRSRSRDRRRSPSRSPIRNRRRTRSRERRRSRSVERRRSRSRGRRRSRERRRSPSLSPIRRGRSRSRSRSIERKRRRQRESRSPVSERSK